MAQAEDVWDDCSVGGGRFSGGAWFIVGQNVGVDPDTRIFDVPSIYHLGVFSVGCRRHVIPFHTQPVPLDIRVNLTMPYAPVGAVVYEGLNHSIYPVPGHPEFGYIISYRFPPAPYSTAENKFPLDWIAIHDGIFPSPALSATSNVADSGSDGRHIINYLQSRFRLVWRGALPVPPMELTGENNIAFQALTAKVETQRRVGGVTSWDESPSSGGYYRLYISVPANSTCTTPPASDMVKLPMVYANEFTGEGSTRGDTNFDLTFSGCSQGMYAIRYKFYSTNPADNADTTNAAKGLVSLNNQPGSASGIKVQIIDRNTNTPITLDQFRIVPQYTGIQTGFTLPFKARYYQTDPQVTGGKVNATAFFQILYQ